MHNGLQITTFSVADFNKNNAKYRVRTGPGRSGKSWNFIIIMAFSRTGKSWKVLEIC